MDKPVKSTVYLDEKSRLMLEKLRKKTGDSNSEIIKNALWFYVELDTHIEATMRRVIAEGVKEIKEAMHEELASLIIKEAK